MCNAFSCICPEVGEVVWKLGTDSHSDLIREAGLRDDTNDPKHMTFAKIEITPDNNDYRKPDKWTLHIDETITPAWWNKAYEASCWDAHKAWCKQLYKILDVDKVIVNPFKDVKPPKKIGKKHIKLLRKWDSVWASVRASVGASAGDSAGDSVWDSVGASVRASAWDSVGASVRASVRANVWDSVWASAWDSVWASVWAQVGSLYNIPRDQWKYCEKLTGKGCPFQSAVDLWNLGLVPSFDGKTYRLHGGPKAEVMFEIGVKELKEYK